jgi:hypothetical protein
LLIVKTFYHLSHFKFYLKLKYLLLHKFAFFRSGSIAHPIYDELNANIITLIVFMDNEYTVHSFKLMMRDSNQKKEF